MKRRCATHYDERSFRMREHREAYSPTLPKLSVTVTYVVLYRNASENIPDSLIKTQHHQLNMCFNGLNDTLGLVPSTGKYAFTNVVGVPNIVFAPADSSKLTNIKRLSCASNQNMASIDDMISVAKSLGFVSIPGQLTIYIGFFSPMPNVSFSILGEAKVLGTKGGNQLAVDYRSVGGPDALGKFSDFGRGMTLVHEVGHALSLVHIWNSSSKTKLYADIPLQKQPNDSFHLSSENTSNDNCMLDCKNNTGRSWLIEQASDCNTVSLFEMGCNFMDYASDMNMAMFTVEQVLAMRENLQSGLSNISFTVGNVTTVTNATNTTTTPVTDAARIPVEPYKSVAELAQTPAVVGVVLFLVALVALGIAFAIFRNVYILYVLGMMLLLFVTAVAIIFKYNTMDSLFKKKKIVSKPRPSMTNSRVTNLKVDSVTDTSVKLSWSAIHGATMYTVNSEVVNGTTFSKTDCLPDTPITFEIKPRFTLKFLSSLNILLGKGVSCTARTWASPPTNVRFANHVLSWTGSAKSFNVYKDGQLSVRNLSETSFTFSDVDEAAFSVASVNADGVEGERISV